MATHEMTLAFCVCAPSAPNSGKGESARLTFDAVLAEVRARAEERAQREVDHMQRAASGRLLIGGKAHEFLSFKPDPEKVRAYMEACVKRCEERLLDALVNIALNGDAQ